METRLYKKLKALNISYEVFEHEAFFTCEESAEFAAQHPGGHAKTLFLRDKKKRNYFLAIVESNNHVDTKELCAHFQCAGGKLSFASPDDLMQTLGVTPGSVTPFALLKDTDPKINTVLIDEAMKKNEKIYFHPMRNTATVCLSLSDFHQFLSSLPHKTEFYNFKNEKN